MPPFRHYASHDVPLIDTTPDISLSCQAILRHAPHFRYAITYYMLFASQLRFHIIHMVFIDIYCHIFSIVLYWLHTIVVDIGFSQILYFHTYDTTLLSTLLHYINK